MTRYDVFLSHASADKPAVERLAQKLLQAKIEPFLDKWHLIPGEPWQEALEEALDHSRSCAVFLGRTLGPWQNEEMRSALEEQVRGRSYRVIPVLLPGGKQPDDRELPRFLRRRTWVDFRADLDDEEAFRRLVAGIRGQAPGPGEGEGGEGPHSLSDSYRCMAPARELFVPRSESEEAVQALLGGSGGDSQLSVSRIVALHGPGGFGKTALALELCYDSRVRAQYPDGILWTAMGDEIEAAGRLARIRDLIRWWTEKDPPAFETVFAASAQLREELKGRRVLLVIDDVWHPEDVILFQGLGGGTALLVTTRDRGTLPADLEPISVGALKVPEAVQLLRTGLPSGMDAGLQQLAARLGEWPLLLKIIHRQLRELIQQDHLSLEDSIREVNEALDDEGLTAFDREDLDSRAQAVARTVGVSLRRLKDEEAARFEQLAIFPEDKDIPLRVLEKLWELGSTATKRLCDRLYDLSLLFRFDRRAGTIRLYRILRAYLVEKRESDLPAWNQRLLDVYRPAGGRWPDLPREEVYLWNHLVHHLMGVGQRDTCRTLLLDFQYLASKLAATDMNAVLVEYSFLVEKDEELRLVRDALRLSAHVLSRDPHQLREQLWGRLRDRNEAGMQGLLQQAIAVSSPPWLRLRSASLDGPGGALIRIISLPEPPRSLAPLDDRRVVSVSEDGTLRIWDLESGRVVHVETGLSITAVAVLRQSPRLVSGSRDGTLRVWDRETMRLLSVFSGPSSFIRSLAELDERRVVSSSEDRRLRIWDLAAGRVLMELQGQTRRIHAIAALDRRRVVSGSEDRTLRVWDIESGQTLITLKGPDGIHAVAALDSRRVVSGSEDGTLRVWDVDRGEALSVFQGHTRRVNAVAALDGRRVVSGSSDRTLRVWDLDSQRALSVLEGHFDSIKAVVALTPHRVVSTAKDETLRIWDVARGQAPGVTWHSGAVTAVAVLEDGRAVTGSLDGTLQVWEVASGRPLAVLQHTERIKGIKAVDVLDSRRVISGSSDGTLRVWDLATGKILQTLAGSPVDIHAVAVLDRRRLVSGSSDGTVRIWDLETGKVLSALGDGPVHVFTVAVLSPPRVISGSADGMLRVWNADSGQEIAAFQGSSDPIYKVAVLDERRVIAGSSDGTLRLWDLDRRQPLTTLQGHSKGVYAMAVLDRRRLVSGSSDNTLRVWNLETGETECLVALDASVWALAVIPESRIVIAGDTSGRAHFFDFVE